VLIRTIPLDFITSVCSVEARLDSNASTTEGSGEGAEHDHSRSGLSSKRSAGSSLITCQLTKAHRDTDPGTFTAADEALLKPDYQNFKFDQAGLDLEEFDELWLFGVGGPTETSAVTDSELAAISRFMQNGGGVFATGDHEDLGLPLNGRIPRVRTMRKWYFGADQIPAEFTTPPPLAPAATPFSPATS
jgi:hypothetical protein